MTNRQIRIANMALYAFWCACAVGGTLIAHSIGHSLVWAAVGAFLGTMAGLIATEVARLLICGPALRERRVAMARRLASEVYTVVEYCGETIRLER